MMRRSSDRIFIFFLSLFILSILLVGKLFLPFLSIIVLAYVVTGIFNPVYQFIQIKDKINPPIASMLTCILIFIILFIPIVLFVGVIANEARDLFIVGKNAVLGGKIVARFEHSQVLERINIFLARFDYRLTLEEVNRWIAAIGQNVGLYLFEQAQWITSNMLKLFINFFFMILVIYFLFIDGQKLVAFIVDLSPLPDDQDEKLIQKFKDMAGAVLIGNGICGTIQGILGGIVLGFFGFKSPLLWGIILGLLAFLPILGIGLVFIPVAIWLLLKGQVAQGLFILIFYMVLSLGVEYLLKPKLVGDRVKMHTLLVFLSIIGGLKLFGILGIIYGPLIVTFFLTLTDIYYTNYRNMVETDG